MPLTLTPASDLEIPSDVDFLLESEEELDSEVERFVEVEMPDPDVYLTYEAYLEWLEPDTHAEWMDGKIVMHSPVSAPHVRVGRFFKAILLAYLDENPIGEFFDDPFQIRIGETFPGRAPDITFLRNENAHRLEDSVVIRGAPDLIVEIISPGSRNRKRDRVEKFSEYERGRVPEYWLIDPAKQSVDVYTLSEEGRYHRIAEDVDGRIFSTVLPGFFIVRDWFWNPPKIREVTTAWWSASPKLFSADIIGGNEAR